MSDTNNTDLARVEAKLDILINLMAATAPSAYSAQDSLRKT